MGGKGLLANVLFRVRYEKVREKKGGTCERRKGKIEVMRVK
jgi:hypothetical protein